MRLHADAALTLSQRRRMVRLVVEQEWSIAGAAAEFKISPKTCSKWVARYRQPSEPGLLDRSSACARVANRTDERRIEAIRVLRRLRFTGPEIAELLDMPVSTVSGILTRIGMGRLGRLGRQPARRYQRARPGELVHIDVKKLGRIVGGAGKRVRGGNNHYTGSFTDAAGASGDGAARAAPKSAVAKRRGPLGVCVVISAGRWRQRAEGRGRRARAPYGSPGPIS